MNRLMNQLPWENPSEHFSPEVIAQWKFHCHYVSVKTKRVLTHAKGQLRTFDLAAMNFCLACSKNVTKRSRKGCTALVQPTQLTIAP